MKPEIMKHFVEVALKAVDCKPDVTIQTDFSDETDFAINVGDGEFVFYIMKDKFHLDVAHYSPGTYYEPPDVDIEELVFPSFAKALDEMCKRVLDDTISNIALDIEFAKDEESGYLESL